MSALREQIARICGANVTSMQRLSGGDVAESFRVVLGDERTVFAKTKSGAPIGFFSTESAGLSWLAEAQAAHVAEVIGVVDEEPPVLVLEWIDVGGARTPSGEVQFGRELARMHQAGAKAFGRQDRATTGSLELPNEPVDTWSEFYAANRLLPLVDVAASRNSLTAGTLERVVRLADKLVEFDSGEAPCRLHGDLWAGNRLVGADGRSWLIDPAAHGGHREFDLAMMLLFGGFGSECFDAYHEAFPLDPEWEERVPLHQLAPLMVHAIKFGGPYGGAVDAALIKLG